LNIIYLGFWISVGLAVLQILGAINIGWWLVAAPLLVGVGITVALILIAFVVAILVAALSK
jgi:hypothetical protein